MFLVILFVVCSGKLLHLLDAWHLKGCYGEQAGKFACCGLGQGTLMGCPHHYVEDRWPSFPSEERVGGRRAFD